MKIGVLAIQGDYEAHGRMLERLGVEPVFVRAPADLEGISGLILPGGESSTHMKVLTEDTTIHERFLKIAKNGH